MADKVFQLLKGAGCDYIHIGGGEPLLNPNRIFPILESARAHNIGVDYIETNASWFKDEKSTIPILKELMKRGVHQLLISIDPYHNEYIPFYKTKGLIKACDKAGMGVFPWLMEFWKDLDAFDDRRPHALEEYARKFGEGYLRELPKRYGLNFKGRALYTYKSMMELEDFDKILRYSTPCGLLTGVHHFHVDLYGNFIPQSCPGLSVKLDELLNGANSDKYAIFHSLDTFGIKGLAKLAIGEYDYEPKEKYAGQCDLCYSIRKYLALKRKLNLPDLQPVEHYKFI